MNTLAIAMIKNEADIVEAFVRHNLELMDLMVVIDNGSTDGTREILTSLQREGLPLVVFDDPIFGYYQSEKVTHVYRKVVPVFNPELVWFLDADEFIHAPSRAALDAAFAAVPAGDAVLLPWRTHLPEAPRSTRRACWPTRSARCPTAAGARSRTYFKVVVRRDPRDDDAPGDRAGQPQRPLHRRHAPAAARDGRRQPSPTCRCAASSSCRPR